MYLDEIAKVIEHLHDSPMIQNARSQSSLVELDMALHGTGVIGGKLLPPNIETASVSTVFYKM